MSDDSGVAAWRGVLLAQNRVIAAIEADLQAARLVPLAVYDVLLELNAAPDRRLRMQELGQRVVLSRSRVSRLVDDMEKDGLVVREPDPADGRAVLATMTDAGRRAFRAAMPIYLDGIERHFAAHLGQGERQAIARGLGRVVEHHDGAQT